jgi:uncharacterized RDD family membrane protein YckC
MKCPKCGYLGFESGDRCRNCGYEFSLSAVSADPLDVALDLGPDESKPPLDLDRIIGAPQPPAGDDLPLFAPPHEGADGRSAGRRTEARAVVQDDAPLINAASRPRAPLGVRRATPEIPRARARAARNPTPDTLFETPRPAVGDRRSDDAHPRQASGDPLAGAASRILAGLVDVALLSILDAFILYLTLRLLGLATPQIFALPLLPLIAFFVLLNGGYFVAFTAVGGQSIGKMAFGIKVISQEDSAVPIGRATLRTAAYFASALPLGAGFLPGVISADRLALHDRVAHTRVVRPSST